MGGNSLARLELIAKTVQELVVVSLILSTVGVIAVFSALALTVIEFRRLMS